MCTKDRMFKVSGRQNFECNSRLDRASLSTSECFQAHMVSVFLLFSLYDSTHVLSVLYKMSFCALDFQFSSPH